ICQLKPGQLSLYQLPFYDRSIQKRDPKTVGHQGFNCLELTDCHDTLKAVQRIVYAVQRIFEDGPGSRTFLTKNKPFPIQFIQRYAAPCQTVSRLTYAKKILSAEQLRLIPAALKKAL